MRNTQFADGEYYHVYNRGTEKRKIFICKKDYLRFIDTVRVSNSIYPIGHLNNNGVKSDVPEIDMAIAEIVAYCLMPNHFHFILKQLKETGVSKFIQKLSTGYTMYFNKRYERSGVLFQGSYKSKHVGDDSYLLHLSRYIHLNPLELNESLNSDNKTADTFLSGYPWSSYLEFLGEKKIEAVTKNHEIIIDQVGGKEKYKKFVLSYAEVSKRKKLSRFNLDKR